MTELKLWSVVMLQSKYDNYYVADTVFNEDEDSGRRKEYAITSRLEEAKRFTPEQASEYAATLRLHMPVKVVDCEEFVTIREVKAKK